MAINDNVSGMEATVEFDGQPVVEYDEYDDALLKKLPPKTTVKYIEAKNDALFGVRIHVAADSALFDTNIEHVVCVDEQRVVYTDKEAGTGSPIRGSARIYNGETIYYVDGTAFKPFLFDCTNIVEADEDDDDRLALDKELSKGWGKTEVFIHKVNKVERKDEFEFRPSEMPKSKTI